MKHETTHVNLDFKLSPKVQNICVILVLIAVASFLVTLKMNPTRAWLNLLINNYIFIGLGTSAAFFLAITGILKASWTAPFKRTFEAMVSVLPLGFVFMLISIAGIHYIYEWSHTEVVMNDPLLVKKIAFLNTKSYIIRMVIYFVIWIGFTRLLVALNRKLEETRDTKVLVEITKYSSIFLVFFGLSTSLASFDWLMSIEPHWFSTIYAVNTFAGNFVAGICFVTLVTLYLQKQGLVQNINENHYHDLGKWMFGFSTFWAYTWLAQYLLIWYANIPEETQYYVLRSQHGWKFFFFLNLIINWVVPFFGLMKRDAKRSKCVLGTMAVILLLGHWLDMYLLAAPGVLHHADQHITLGLTELFMYVGFGALVFLITLKLLAKRKLQPSFDPVLEEGLHLHQ